MKTIKAKTAKLLSAFLIAALLAGMGVPAYAYNFSFSSGADHSEALGKPTSTDNHVAPNPMTQNIRRNKDAAHFPPAYGVFSGDIPTGPTSLYHDNSMPHSGYTGNPFPSAYGAGSASDWNSTGGGVSPIAGSDSGGMLPATSVLPAEAERGAATTQPLFYADGSIGKLHIPKLNLTVTVYDGETPDNMRAGVGRFESTSAWDGNVGIAGHNRGVPSAIGGVKDLADGDVITYTTQYGTRTYEVFFRQQVDETDYSRLGRSDTNILTLITCVENVPAMRWCVQAREKIN